MHDVSILFSELMQTISMLIMLLVCIFGLGSENCSQVIRLGQLSSYAAFLFDWIGNF